MSRTYSRPYVGVNGTRREVFRASVTPTPESHPQFGAVIGPFRTIGAARLAAGPHGPLMQTVADFERAARRPTLKDCEMHTWFERDRQHVELRDNRTDKTIVQWWDEAVTEAVEDGFLDPRDWIGSAFDYARSHGMVRS